MKTKNEHLKITPNFRTLTFTIRTIKYGRCSVKRRTYPMSIELFHTFLDQSMEDWESFLANSALWYQV